METAPDTQKYSVTFRFDLENMPKCLFCFTPKRILENFEFLWEESKLRREISPVLMENCLLETLVAVFRLAGIPESSMAQKETEHTALALAKGYIADNIDRAPGVAEVAAYCALSSKQLTRIFLQYEDMTPGEYIKGKRIQRAEKLLTDQSLSLKQISEIMNFSSEYYFNEFMKKFCGMPPGAYRKMLGH